MSPYKSLRHYYWLLTGFFRKHVVLFIFSLVAAFLMIILIINFFPFLNTLLFQKQEIIGMVGQYTIRTIPLPIMNQISNPLILIDQNGDIQPLLAHSWETLNNGKTYRFHLRNDLYWSDGKRFTSKDISYNFLDVTIKPIDDYTIDFNLKVPLAIFPIYLTQPVVKKPLVGLGGPYRVESFKHNKDTVLSINLAPNKPDLPYRVYRFYNTEEDLINAYKKGEITQFTTTNKSVQDSFKSWKNTELSRTVDYNKVMALFFNNADGPLHEREVRKAFASATPLFPDKGERAKGPISPTSWAYYDNVKEYPYDEELARELVKKNVSSSDSAALKMYTYFDYIDTAEALKANYERVGMKIDLKVARGAPTDYNYDVFLAVWDTPIDPDQYFFWHSSQTQTNITKLNDPKVDKLLQDGRSVLNIRQRQNIYRSFQKAIADELPAYFMYHPFEYIVRRK